MNDNKLVDSTTFLRLKELCKSNTEQLKQTFNFNLNNQSPSEVSKADWETACNILKNAVIYINYTNWKNENYTRAIMPLNLEYKSTRHHGETQYIMDALDLKNMDVRNFAVANIHWITHFRKGGPLVLDERLRNTIVFVVTFCVIIVFYFLWFVVWK